MTFPLWLLNVVQDPKVPVTAIEAQGWLIAVVGASMGLVKIALWLRNYKEQKNGNGSYDVSQELKEKLANMSNTFERILTKVTMNEDKLVENQKVLSDHQQKLSENQLKALENHARLLEAITLMRMELRNVESNVLSAQEKRAMLDLSELKDYLRNNLSGK